jgi:pyruvate formate lyase activating enzyme
MKKGFLGNYAPCFFSNPLGDRRVQGHLCQRRCRIVPNKSGYCGTRKNLDRKLFSLLYGRVSSMRISPAEIKPLFHFYPGSQWLSVGSLGCNFLCPGCQNWEIAHAEVEKELPSLRFVPPEEAVQLARGIPGAHHLIPFDTSK